MKDSPLLINCDMGEWDAPHLLPIDEELMPYVDLCNIACGGHAGSEKIMALTLNFAMQNGVKIGAHPGYEDRTNFGRIYISLPSKELLDSLKIQLDLFLTICSRHNAEPHHIKAHGALYHACNQNEEEAEVLLKVVKAHCPQLLILVAPGSLLETKAKNEGLRTLAESFIDRRYSDDLSLISRTELDAVIEDEHEAKDQFDKLSEGKIITKSGHISTLISQTSCIHGDNPNCLGILKKIRYA